MESTKLGKFEVVYPNQREFHSIKREIWGQDCYYFETDNPKPFIIDIGAHIGISVLYFKALYPNSNIIAFEPNPKNLDYLNENILINGLDDTSVIPKAIWKENGVKKLYIDSTDNDWNSNSSFLEGSWNGKENTESISVETTRLDEFIENRCVDCLKLDVEGSEISILKSIKKYFNNIENIFIEYHPTSTNRIKDLENLLKGSFNLEFYDEGSLLKKPADNKLLTVVGKK